MAIALAAPLTGNGYEVRLAGTRLNREITTLIQEMGIHLSPGLEVPGGVTIHQLEGVPRAFEGIKSVMGGVNLFGVGWVGDQFASLLCPGMHVIAPAKGMQADDGGNLTILSRALVSCPPEELRSQVSAFATVGPSIAGEVAVYRRVSVMFIGEDPEVPTCWHELFVTGRCHAWINANFVDVEVYAATKNCYAFRAGFM